MRTSSNSRRGYLLLELCWVIALAGLLLAVVIPLGGRWRERTESDWVMQAVVSAVEETQAVARGNSAVRPLLIVSGAPDNDWYTVYQTHRLSIRGKLPKGYSFVSTAPLFLEFQKNGRVGHIGFGIERTHRIGVRTPAGRVRTVVISAQTGRVRVEG